MERTLIGDLRQAIGQKVKISGWLQVLRDQKKMQFLVVRDRTGAVQVVFEKKADPELAEVISTLGSESAITLTGMVVDNPIVKLGGLELVLETLDVVNKAEAPLPFEPFNDTLPSVDFRMDWRYLDLRRQQSLLTFKVQTTAEMAMRDYWMKQGFIEMHSPKIMGTPSESGAELFELAYFDRKAYLAQSPQFFKQMAMAAGFEKVFEIGPVFRADPSFTSRHMTEFTGVDVEISWVDSHEDVMAFQERWLQYVYQQVKDAHGEEIKEVFGFDFEVPSVPFPRVTMAEAIEILRSVGYELPAERKGDIDPGGERALGDYIKQKYNHDFVFVTDWPISVRPFYHMRHPENPGLTRSYDLIAKGLEITTGAQREHRFEVLRTQAFEKGLTEGPIQFYLNYFRYGCPSHGGFGLGLSRLLMVMLNLPNVRDAVYLFRGPNRLEP
ncbi:aspartyl-tRNA synthetase [Ornatilinea apprima]|uniref:Aspartate--tRNA ligase n=1 Tax=Ornatilinea apprima TaxID=1134406 RepID=A0A0P6XHA0_9CHLR|nr:aspartate--tRNA(Asn) ligase [Ornatilinea apprima]KPL79175.1 aspartyl-tRNA synthetase [Ornatilinea apprima]